MKTKTNELIGPALDWAVAKCRGFDGLDKDLWLMRDGIAAMPLHAYTPSTYWAQGGPIIERELISVSSQTNGHSWAAKGAHNYSYGPTPLIAAMRCFVASKLGDEVDVPEELCASST